MLSGNTGVASTPPEHLLRAASQITGDHDVVVFGSPSVLAGIPEDRLPAVATASIEAEFAFMNDSDAEKANTVDGAIGELSPFHLNHGYYAQGVSLTTAVLPSGWEERLIPLDTPSTDPGRGLCLDPHDCVSAKLMAGRDKDRAFACALLRAGLINADVLLQRLESTPDAHPLALARARTWLLSMRS